MVFPEWKKRENFTGFIGRNKYIWQLKRMLPTKREIYSQSE